MLIPTLSELERVLEVVSQDLTTQRTRVGDLDRALKVARREVEKRQHVYDYVVYCYNKQRAEEKDNESNHTS